MWKYKETYYTVIDRDRLNEQVPINISSQLGYGDEAQLFGQLVWKARELDNGQYACSIQLMPIGLKEYEGVNSWITESDYKIAEQLFDNIITEEEFLQLEFANEDKSLI